MHGTENKSQQEMVKERDRGVGKKGGRYLIYVHYNSHTPKEAR
jgi:hypothetical protein